MGSIEYHLQRFLPLWRKSAPHIARLLLVSTFLEDGLRMISYWKLQMNYFHSLYSYPAVLFIMTVNCVLQIGGALLILLRKYSDIGVFILFFVLLFQLALYNLAWSFPFISRYMALAGSLALLLADSRTSKKDTFAGVPSLGKEETARTYLLLIGRLLLLLMFVSLIHPRMSIGRWIITAVDTVLMACVAVGFHAKAASVLLGVILFAFNFVLNNFWSAPTWEYDFLKYDFFQTLSVIGGLVLLTYLGAGDLSVDARKKEY